MPGLLYTCIYVVYNREEYETQMYMWLITIENKIPGREYFVHLHVVDNHWMF